MNPARFAARQSRAVVLMTVLAAVAGVLVRPRLDPRFVRLQTMFLIGFAGAVFVVCEVGRVMLVGGRPTLMSVLLKLSALVFGLSMASLAMSGRLHQHEAR